MFKKTIKKIITKKQRTLPFYELNKKSRFKKRKSLNINFSKIFSFLPKKNNKGILLSLFFSIIWIVLFLIFWPFLRVNDIEITRKDYITNINIAYKSVDLVRGKSIFLIDYDNIKDKINE